MKLSRQALIALGITGVGMLSAKDLTREQIDQMLKELVAKPVQKEIMGACCYKPAGYPERIDYLCPLCKTKTHHEKPEHTGYVKIADTYRQQMKRIKELGLDAALDETDLCSQCRRDKDTKAVNFYILVTLDNRVVRTQLDSDDLRKITAFLEKKDVWTTSNDGKYPLQPALPRIRKILGME